MLPIVLIAAVASNGVIGRDNGLIWRLKADMKHFRARTMGKPVIMGRKTYQSIGRPLPGRDSIVLTRDTAFHADGVLTAQTIDEALVKADRAATQRGAIEIMVAGGAEIYTQLLPMAARLDLTEVDLAPEGDAHFPAVDPAIWRLASRVAHPADPDNEAAFAFATYVRRAA